MFQKNLFRAKLVSLEITLKDAASIIGVNEATLHRKMNGSSDFTRNEIQLLRQALNLSAAEVDEIFFAPQLTFK